MNIHDIIGNSMVQASAGTVATGAALAAFNRWSGANDIVRYTGDITRATEDYASQMGLDVEGVKKEQLAAENIGSLFIANAETAAITIMDGLSSKRSAVRLGSDGAKIALAQARGMIDKPEKIFEVLGHQVDAKALPPDLKKESIAQSRNWARPTSWKALWALVARDAAYSDRAKKIQEPLDFLAKVLAASPEQSVDLSGPCHIALKVPNPNGKPDIIVMPTIDSEAGLIRKIEKSEVVLPGSERTATAVRDALVKLHQPQQKKFQQASKPDAP